MTLNKNGWEPNVGGNRLNRITLTINTPWGVRHSVEAPRNTPRLASAALQRGRFSSPTSPNFWHAELAIANVT